MSAPGEVVGGRAAAVETVVPAPPRKATPLPVLAPPPVPSWRLLATLGGAGALAGLLIVLAYQATLPSIEAHKAEVLRAAVEEVLHAPERADTLYLSGNALVATLPPGVDGAKLERVYRGYGPGGKPVGYAISASRAGFADQIELLFGYEPGTKRLLGMKILASKETPGLGDKIELPSFTGQFAGRVAPLTGVKGAAPAGDRGAVVMITGATISSRTIVREINDAIERWQPLLEAYGRGGAQR